MPRYWMASVVDGMLAALLDSMSAAAVARDVSMGSTMLSASCCA
jgi:hypothetical protein